MRISAYAERLLQGLNDIDWMKVSRRVNVIGLEINWGYGWFSSYVSRY
jgi:hypothetical protein